MAHRHRKIRERGPYGCAGNVSYTATCICGAERTTCACHQCREQGTNDSGWYMPICPQCDRGHAADVACPTVESGSARQRGAYEIERDGY